MHSASCRRGRNTTWGGPSNDEGYGVAVAGDVVYVSGATGSYGAGSEDVMLIKYSSSGYKLWSATWGGASGDTSTGVAVTGDGVYVTGYTRSYGAGNDDTILIKYSRLSSTSTADLTFTLELFAGWNMVSLPVLPDDPLASTVLSGIEFNQLVTWSGTGYVTASEFEAGRGYWLLVMEDTNVTISGTPVQSLNLTLAPGWSMIGGPDNDVPTADAFPGFYQLVTWTGTGYTSATVFEPGKGYWALVLEETQIPLSPI